MPDAERAADSTGLSLRQQHRDMVPCRDSIVKGFQVLTRSLWCLHIPYPLVIPFTGHLRPAQQAIAPVSSCGLKHYWLGGLRSVKYIQEERQTLSGSHCPL